MQQVSWLLKGKVLRTVFSGRMSLAQIEAAGESICHLLERHATSPIYLIIDASSLKSLPRAPGPLKAALGWMQDPNLGQVIVYGSRSAIDHVLILLAARALDVNYAATATETEALELLAQIDVTLPGLLAMQKS